MRYSPSIPGLTLAKSVRLPADDAPCAVAVLTYPARDADHDYVRPDGGDWVKKPVVNWDHGCPVGVGRPVELCPVAIDGATRQLPVGTALFFQSAADLKDVDLTRYEWAANGASRKPAGRYNPDDCLALAADTHRLVADGAADGVSVEFTPLGTEGHSWWPTGGTSPINARPSYHFDRWKGTGWAFTANPVNAHARVLTDSPFYLPPDSPLLAKAYRIAETGRFPGGRHCHAAIRKSLTAALPRRPVAVVGGYRSHTQPAGETQAMPAPTRFRKAEGDEMMPSADEMMPPADEPMTPDLDNVADDAGTPMKATPAACMTLMQAIADAADQCDAMAESPDLEHVEGIEAIRQFGESIRQANAMFREQVVAMFPDAGIEVPTDLPADAYAADDSAEMPATADGALIGKSFRKGFPVARFSLAQVGKSKKLSAADAAEVASLKTRIAKLALR